jgi:predicted TIM-barrel fold metal-dependent hydrolase
MTKTTQQTNIRPDWLAGVNEEVLEPELEAVDPHHHLWDHAASTYLADDFLRDAIPHGVTKSVFVECGSMYRPTGPEALRPVGETEFVEAIAQKVERGSVGCAVNAGIVGHADLMLGDAVEAVFEAHLAASPKRFRGIRHSAAWHASDSIRQSHSRPPAHMLTLKRFREGFALLGKYGLSFDAWLFHSQLGELLALARDFPEITIVLDHMGGPLGIGPYAGKRDEVFSDWAKSMEALARLENVTVKLGGLQMAISGFGWHHRSLPPTSAELAETVGPYYLHCIDHFGAHRCMFESNFPVDKVSCSYTVLWNAFKRLSQDYSESDRKALFSGTAQRVYRL